SARIDDPRRPAQPPRGWWRLFPPAAVLVDALGNLPRERAGEPPGHLLPAPLGDRSRSAAPGRGPAEPVPPLPEPRAYRDAAASIADRLPVRRDGYRRLSRPPGTQLRSVGHARAPLLVVSPLAGPALAEGDDLMVSEYPASSLIVSRANDGKEWD